MAFSTGSRVDYVDLQSYYQSFNTFISNYANGVISTLTIPSSGKSVQPVDVTNLNTKIQNFKSDEYLGTESSLWIPVTAPTVGDLLRASTWTNITTTINNMAVVKCRNKANNTYSTQTCQPKNCSAQGTCSKVCSHAVKTVTCNHTTRSVSCNHGTNSVSCSHVANSVSCSHVANTVSCSNGNNTNGTFTSVYGSGNSRWVDNQVNTNWVLTGSGCGFTVCNGVCNKNANDAVGCVYMEYGGRWGRQCSVACINGKRNHNCSNGTKTHNCSRGTKTHNCSNGTHSHNCKHGTHSQVCNHGSNSNTSCTYDVTTCSPKGTTIDIRNAKATMSKT